MGAGSHTLGTAATIPLQRDIELLLGDVDAKPGGNGHVHVLGDVCKKSRAGSAVRQPCTQGQVLRDNQNPSSSDNLPYIRWWSSVRWASWCQARIRQRRGPKGPG